MIEIKVDRNTESRVDDKDSSDAFVHVQEDSLVSIETTSMARELPASGSRSDDKQDHRGKNKTTGAQCREFDGKEEVLHIRDDKSGQMVRGQVP